MFEIKGKSLISLFQSNTIFTRTKSPLNDLGDTIKRQSWRKIQLSLKNKTNKACPCFNKNTLTHMLNTQHQKLHSTQKKTLKQNQDTITIKPKATLGQVKLLMIFQQDTNQLGHQQVGN